MGRLGSHYILHQVLNSSTTQNRLCTACARLCGSTMMCVLQGKNHFWPWRWGVVLIQLSKENLNQKIPSGHGQRAPGVSVGRLGSHYNHTRYRIRRPLEIDFTQPVLDFVGLR